MGDGCSGSQVLGGWRAHLLLTARPRPRQLLFQESNPGVRYEYTIQREADGHSQVEPSEFSWRYGPWTKCTVTCGTGEDRGGHSCGPTGPGSGQQCPASTSSSLLLGEPPRAWSAALRTPVALCLEWGR